MCFLLACTHHCFACVALLAVSGLLVVSNGVNFPHLERGEETMEEVSECVCVGHSDLSLSDLSLSDLFLPTPLLLVLVIVIAGAAEDVSKAVCCRPI